LHENRVQPSLELEAYRLKHTDMLKAKSGMQSDRRRVNRIANDRYQLPGTNFLASRNQLWQEELADAFSDVHRMDVD
jgi:hypothetical protein